MFEIPSQERLLYYGLETVNRECWPVHWEEYDSLKSLRQHLFSVMHRHKGIGIAAPQIGVFRQYFLVLTDEGDIVDVMNPEVIQTWGHEREGFEACLSLPPHNNGCKVPRLEKIRIEFSSASDPHTRTIRQFTGMDAIVIQHELDHLTGTFFIDRIADKRRSEVLSSFNQWKEKYQCKGQFPTTPR